VDRFGAHRVARDAGGADLILFVEVRAAGLLQQKLWRHPLVRRHPSRCFAFCSFDGVVPFLPGVYASLPRHRHDRSRHRSGHYLRALFRRVPAPAGTPADPPLLASFRGCLRTHAVRPGLAALSSARIRVEDSDGERDFKAPGRAYMGYSGAAVESYLRLIERSAFVLCPRGRGASSLRLFETLQLGRVPVIISDDWVAPDGPAWETFSVRVAERDVPRIPRILAELEPRAAEMGRRARAAWVEWFSEEVSFHRAVESCLDIARGRRATEPVRRWLSLARLFDPDFAALLWRTHSPRLARAVRPRSPASR
jgi:hypothetical protein